MHEIGEFIFALLIDEKHLFVSVEMIRSRRAFLSFSFFQGHNLNLAHSSDENFDFLIDTEYDDQIGYVSRMRLRQVRCIVVSSEFYPPSIDRWDTHMRMLRKCVIILRKHFNLDGLVTRQLFANRPYASLAILSLEALWTMTVPMSILSLSR
jgi:hypothetical protein